MKNTIARFLLPIVIAAFCTVTAAQELTVRTIMAEPSIAGQRVEGEKISPDGTMVIYLWNAEGKPKRDLYLVPTNGGDAKIILRASDLPKPFRPEEKENKLDYGLELRDDFVKERENRLGNFEWSPDSKRLIFSFGGDIYTLTIADNSVKRYTNTRSPEFGAEFIDNERIIYSSGGHTFILNTTDATLTQITKESDGRFVSAGRITVNKPGTLVAYVVSDSSKYKSLVVPDYLGEFATAGTRRRGWSEQKLYVTLADGSRNEPFEIELPKKEGVGGIRSIKWAADNTSLIVDRTDKDLKRRQLFYIKNAGGKGQQIITVTEETDAKWLAPLSYIVEPNPENAGQLFFASERDGFNHLYLATLETPAEQPADTQAETRPADTQAETRPVGSVPSEATLTGTEPAPTVKIEQLTKGNWQVEWGKWFDNGNDIIYASTDFGTAEREFFVIETLDDANPQEWKVDLPKGMKTGPQIVTSGDAVHLIFGYSRWNLPEDLHYQKLCYRCSGGETSPTAVQLSKTVPEAFAKRSWNEPKFISIPSRDGKNIPAKIYLPAGHSAKKKYPMVVFVHGAGYLQNVINGWNNYYREFMFNQLLTQKGYVVLDIDYRGSAGYGRDWRTDVHDFLGGKDMDDHVDAIDFMVANYSVNKDKVGVYGGSYGGFMAGMLAMRAPESVAAAAALRPVFDWKNYYASSPSYTAQRLGFPDKNPEAYKRSSPISYADKLERPLLILHGMADDNVHVQDSIQLMEKLIRLGKTQYFEAMLYPSENHGFARPESWTDEYERILAFFEKHLK